MPIKPIEKDRAPFKTVSRDLLKKKYAFQILTTKKKYF